jgi:N-acetylglucosamine-6-phosphate deacetylase
MLVVGRQKFDGDAAPALLLAGGRVVTPEAVLPDAWVHVAGDTILAVAEQRPAGDIPVVDLDGAWLLPGYIDLHVHGGGGHSVATSPAAMDAAVAFHRSMGTTATLVSLVTASVEELVVQAGWAAALTRRGPTPRGCVLGSHLEGPFLSPHRRGAQNADHMIEPDPETLERLITAGEGELRVMTLAPELAGALALIRRLREHGIVAAIGHSDASYEQAKAAIQAGAGHATHLFNGMAPLHHRTPGLVGAVLEAGVSCELINDGLHLHPAVIALVCRLIECPVLITDAIDATGVGDGTFALGGLAVEVQDAEARLAGTRSLAGSTLTMDQALRRAVRDVGLPIEQAAAAAATNPARVLGLEDRLGSIAAGRRADLVVLDDDLAVHSIMAAGEWLASEDHR